MKDRDSLVPLNRPPVGGARPSEAKKLVRKGLVPLPLARAKALGCPVGSSRGWRRRIG